MKQNMTRYFKYLTPFFVFCFLFFSFIGCSHFRAKPQKPAPEKIWQQVRQSYAEPRPPYAAEGELSLRSPDFNQSFSFTLRWESPQRVRIDVSGFLGFTLASAAVCDSQAWLNIPIKSVYLKGQINRIDSASSNALGFSLDQFLKMLEGRPPLPAGRCDFTGEDGLMDFSCRDSLAAYVFRVDPVLGRITEYRVQTGAGELQQIKYGGWRNLNQVSRPYSIEMKKPRQELELSVTYQKISPVESFKPETWQQPLPQGVNPGEF
jgi:outer membrane biogenesis lipoprotein LolB